MTAAWWAGLAVWCLILPSAESRSRHLFVARRQPGRADPALLGALGALVLALILLGWPMGLLVGAVVAPVTHACVARLESASDRERRAAVAAQLPLALDLVVTTLEAGRPPVVALGLAAEATADPLGAELTQLASRLAIAGDPASVWSSVLDDDTWAPVGRAFRRAETSGMPVAEIISGVADELRLERRARRRDDSRKVAVRTAAPLGVCFLPAFFLIGIVPTVMGAFDSLQF